MRIGIDASCILPRKTGIGQFTMNLLREMLGLSNENGSEFIIFLNSYRHSTPPLPMIEGARVKVKKFRIPGPLLVRAWRHLHFPPIEMFTGFVDLFHSTTGYLPPQIRGQRIATVYDLYFMRHPEHCEALGGRHFLKTMPRLLPRMDHIIAPSNATKHDLMELLKIPEEKITVIYGGVDQQRFHLVTDHSLLETMRQEYCLPRHYILSVSTLEPRKNIEGLLIAYRQLKEILYNPPKLVLAGGKGWHGEAIRAAIRRHRLGQDVLLTGYIPDEHLPLLYNAALIFIYPSLWEGFGMPVLEAMACGAPCLVSNIPALKEIAEDAAMTIDPYNYYEMAERMKDLITSHQLREQLQQKGLVQVQKFSWRLTAQKTLRVYENVTKK